MTTETTSTSRGDRVAIAVSAMADYLGLIVVLLVLVAIFGASSDRFLTRPTFLSIANQIPDLIVIAAGMTLVLIAGGIDLSVGSVLALAGSTLGALMNRAGLPFWAAAPAGLAVGALCGLVSGAITATWSVPSFVVTLGMLEMARGASFLITDSTTQYLGASVEGLAKPVAGLGLSPAFLIAVGVVVLLQVVLTRTVAGRLMVAVGTNEEAVRLAGLDPRPIRVATFALSGALAALGALFQVARLSSADPNAGVGLELSAIAAAVIGGTSLMGGRGSVLRTLLGVLVIAVLQTGLAQVGASEHTKRLITGAVIVLAVVLDVHRQRWLDSISRLLTGALGRRPS